MTNLTTTPRASGLLPPIATAFVGRSGEIADIERLLDDPGCALITVAAPGGMGKTRLALQVAHRAAERGRAVWWIDLVTADDTLTAIARALGISVRAGDGLRGAIATALRDQRALLVLDNMEQLIDQGNELAMLIGLAPGTQLIVTSRERLRLAEEWVYDLGGLPADGDGSHDEAVALFRERARQVAPSRRIERETARAICRAVDGMPLAIELAAAWLRSLTAEDVLSELDRGMGLLTTTLRNVPERHRSVEDVFAQCLSKLEPRLRQAFLRLSVFHGGFTRESARAVCAVSVAELSSLADASLLRLDRDGRYQVHELLRQFAATELEASGESRAIEDAHMEHFADRLREWARGRWQVSQPSTIAGLEPDYGNARLAVRRALERMDLDRLVKPVEMLRTYHEYRGLYHEAMRFMVEVEEAVERRAGGRPALLRALTLIGRGYLDLRLGRLEDAETHICASRAEWEAIGSERPMSGFGVNSFGALAILRLAQGRYEDARAAAMHTLDELSGIAVPDVAIAWYALHGAQRELGDLDDARTSLANASKLVADLNDAWFGAYVAVEEGNLAMLDGRLDDAERAYETSYAMRQPFGDAQGMGLALERLGRVALARGDAAVAERLSKEGLALLRQSGDEGGRAMALTGLARAACLKGDLETARLRFAESLDAALHIGYRPCLYETVIALVESNALPGAWRETDRLLAAVASDPRAPIDIRRRATTLSRGASPGEAARVPIERIAGRLAEALRRAGGPPMDRDGLEPRGSALTPRELKVLELIAQGRTNPEIATQLDISPGTVKWYSSQVMAKLDARNRTDAVGRARARGLVA